jgi:hypothetical protein
MSKVYPSHAMVTAHLKGSGNKAVLSLVKGNCVRKIEEFYDQHPELCDEGLFTSIKVLHDTWCAVQQTGYCNCNPDVELDYPESGKVC